MGPKKLLLNLIKVFLAGCLALVAMTFFCFFYSNSPLHYPNSSGATDYTWQANTFYSTCGEGIAHGRTNNEGLMNLFDYKAGMPIDTLVMGSSHMEAKHVAMSESAASILNSLLPDKTVYNIGVSGHTF